MAELARRLQHFRLAALAQQIQGPVSCELTLRGEEERKLCPWFETRKCLEHGGKTTELAAPPSNCQTGYRQVWSLDTASRRPA
jgi:hypothetical protein